MGGAGEAMLQGTLFSRVKRTGRVERHHVQVGGYERLSSTHVQISSFRGGAMRTLVLVVILLLARPSADARSAPAETARIRRHLSMVEAELRATNVSALTPAQRGARGRNLDVLHAY